MENLKIIENNELQEDEIKIIPIRYNQSIAESNLMILPFISVQNTKVKILKRVWKSNGIERGIEVKGSTDLGVPTIKDLDVLLALFKIMVKNMGNQYEFNVTTNKAKFDTPEIHFTFKELAIEMGYSDISGQIKIMIEKCLKRLNETTIYSQFNGSVREAEKGDYVTEFKGEESFRIIYDLKTYSYTKRKKNGLKLGNAEEVRDGTSLKIHEFFFKNMCDNYFKIYDYSMYLKLRLGITKKLFLILSQWSHGYEKYLTYQVMYDMLGLDVKVMSDVYYSNKQIKKAFTELVSVGFIDDFKEVKNKDGINIIFNARLTSRAKFLESYTSDSEVVARMRELEISYDDIMKYYRLDNQDYVRGMLRYFDFKLKNKEVVKEGIGLLIDGLKRENYDLEGFM